MTGAREDAVALVATALHIEPAVVDDSTALAITPQWDSLAHMRVVLALEERLGRQLGPEAIVAIASLQDVVAILEAETREEERRDDEPRRNN